MSLGKEMWRKHRSVYQDHLKYICNDIVKPFCVRIINYSKRVQYMHDLAKHLPSPSMKGDIYEADNCKFHNEELSVDDIRVSIKYGIPSSMNDELEDN